MSLVLKNSYPSVKKRLKLLKNLKFEILKNEAAICKALHNDLRKSEYESKLTETKFIISELNDTIKNLKDWAKPKRVARNLLTYPAKEYIYQQPYGRVLIFAPWNYPFQLSIAPLIGAIAAGNSVVLKPSEYAPNTTAVIKDILKKVFDIRYVTVIEGDALLAKELLKQQWDYIFYTGSTVVGKEVYLAAAKNLTPVTLELGGKNPCIIDDTANLKKTAKRIIWGKFTNAGQTCIAPDFLVVNKTIKNELIKYLQYYLTKFYTETPEQSPDYGRIIHKKHFQRLITYLDNAHIISGGEYNEKDLYIAPTVIDNPPLQSAVMNDEIFGPILPIITYKYPSDLQDILKRYKNPLAFYVFSTNKEFSNHLIENYSFGGGCVNDVLIHIANNELPFGGIGASGIGKYHGKYSFDTFSHEKAIVKTGRFDNPFRYAPFKKKLRWLTILYRIIG
ncbi:aldehyde dehydrogenase [Neptunitalea chrysea]|uniref:Aldehyde dehydrogenase n=1 Tax=Neptunitalea chrysea TaxID=1647581 RepID=A0A9W6B8K3_9FLAO|nr:aldehyde dehydrogenase [Neptunitalea chrysea]GLB54002.1 aldehyde dehydrogenase [Neptunitalea chrysea]